MEGQNLSCTVLMPSSKDIPVSASYAYVGALQHDFLELAARPHFRQHKLNPLTPEGGKQRVSW